MKGVFSAATGLMLAGAVLVGWPRWRPWDRWQACPRDSVLVGRLCVDKYEASVWEIPASKPWLIAAVREGRIASATGLAGAIQHGVGGDDYDPACPDTGAGCTTFYAASLPSVTPSASLTWFQAVAACRNAGKRLLTNAEWQAAALGTPDHNRDDGVADCNVASTTFALPEDPVPTGSRTGCVSDVGAFDMTGNLWEWVGDWTETAAHCVHWDPAYGSDVTCFDGGGVNHAPAALLRGGTFDGVSAGVFAVNAAFDPTSSFSAFGFRCGREL